MMTTLKDSLSVEQAVDRLSRLSPIVPEAAIILGSGINILENLSDQKSVSFQDVFGVAPNVEGHSGSIEIGKLDGHLVAVLRGRFHRYEGHSWDTVTMPTRAICAWGIPNLYLTNASGGLNPAVQVGDLVLITAFRDHLSAKWQELGLLPAIAAPAVSCSNPLTERVWKISEELKRRHQEFHRVHKGVYVGVLGPCYETMAEVEMLRRLKADAVGMSTIPELLAADGSSTLVAAISVITNSWNSSAIHGHNAVLAAARAASKQLEQLLQACIFPSPATRT
jgi:purine-nucleoside phosphorylase